MGEGMETGSREPLRVKVVTLGIDSMWLRVTENLWQREWALFPRGLNWCLCERCHPSTSGRGLHQEGCRIPTASQG